MSAGPPWLDVVAAAVVGSGVEAGIAVLPDGVTSCELGATVEGLPVLESNEVVPLTPVVGAGVPVLSAVDEVIPVPKSLTPVGLLPGTEMEVPVDGSLEPGTLLFSPVFDNGVLVLGVLIPVVGTIGTNELVIGKERPIPMPLLPGRSLLGPDKPLVGNMVPCVPFVLEKLNGLPEGMGKGSSELCERSAFSWQGEMTERIR